MNLYFFYSSHAPAWEFSPQRSSVAGRWSVYHCVPTPERGNDAKKESVWAKIKKRFEKSVQDKEKS